MMKKYITPEIQAVEFETEDIMTLSPAGNEDITSGIEDNSEYL